MALQYAGAQPGVYWAHQDPVTKSQRLTNTAGDVASNVDVDPWGGETEPKWNTGAERQPRRFTSYERDEVSTLAAHNGDDAQQRRYQAAWARYSQPDPYEGSYDLTNPQSFNRYSYTNNDPVNFVDPSGLLPQSGCSAEYSYSQCGGDGGFWGGGGWGGGGDGFGDDVAAGHDLAGLPGNVRQAVLRYEYTVNNAFYGGGINELSYGGQSWYDGMGTITATGRLEWHQRGVMGNIGDYSRGVADSVVPFGLVERIQGPAADSAAYQAGSGSGVALSMALPEAERQLWTFKKKDR